MWKSYSSIIRKYPKLSLQEERRLIRQAKKHKKRADELVLRHVSFVIFRIHKVTFPVYVHRFGEDILSQAIFLLYQKIKSYDLRYRDEEGNFKPVRFVSYIWKAVDGCILASLKKELERERRERAPEWERFDLDDGLSQVDVEYGKSQCPPHTAGHLSTLSYVLEEKNVRLKYLDILDRFWS